MPLVITGLCLLALGLFCGAVLVAVPLGLVPWAISAVVWVLFPVFCGLGQALFLTGAANAQARAGSLVVSVLLLLQALAAALGLVLMAIGAVASEHSTLSLWYVMAIAGLSGIVGAAAFARAIPGPSPT